MGHGQYDATYWKFYRLTTSTVDFQSLRMAIDAVDVQQLSSVFLNTSADEPPPARVSEAGWAAILRDQELLDLSDEKTTMLDRLVTEFGTIQNAKNVDPAKYDAYVAVRTQYNKKYSTLQEATYKAEYKAWTQQRGRVREATEGSAVSEGSGLSAAVEATDNQVQHLLSGSLEVGSGAFSGSQRSTAAIGETRENDDSGDGGQHLLREDSGGDAAKDNRDVGEADVAEERETMAAEMLDDLQLTESSISAGSTRTFIKSSTEVTRHTLIDDLPMIPGTRRRASSDEQARSPSRPNSTFATSRPLEVRGPVDGHAAATRRDHGFEDRTQTRK